MNNLPTSSARHASAITAWMTVGLCAMLCAGVSNSTGCSRKPPPAPPPPPPPVQEAPPPPPAPAGLTPAQVSARLRPLFVALYEHGFNATALSSPVRSATPAPGAAPTSAPPTLASLVEKECNAAGIEVATVVKCATDVRQKLTPREARDAVLAIYVTQAMHDATAGNLHRAHVLLADTITELTALKADELLASLGALNRFYQDVPSEVQKSALSAHLDAYLQFHEEQLLLLAAHAAVLRAGGLADAAEFAETGLLAHFRLVALPVCELVTTHGESHGWRSPATIKDARARLGAHVDALATGRPTNDAFLKEAAWGDVGKEQAALLAAAQAFPALMKAGSPLRYDPEQQRLAAIGVKSLTDESRIGAAVDWCAGKPAAELFDDGSGHLLVALHWLSQSRAVLAQAALVSGAVGLLEATPVAAVTDGGSDGADAAAALARRLNGYRLLAAAALIQPDLPGAVADPSEPALREIEILLLAWRQAWLKAGLPQKPADGVVAEFSRMLDGGATIPESDRGPRGAERYFFFDYRFLGDGVPEVLVTKAVAEELVEAAGLQELATTERFLEFVKSFKMPRDLSRGPSRR